MFVVRVRGCLDVQPVPGWDLRDRLRSASQASCRDLMVVGEGARAVMCVDWARRSHHERHMQLVPGGDLPDRIRSMSSRAIHLHVQHAAVQTGRAMSIRAIHSHVLHAAVQTGRGTSQALLLLGVSTHGRHVARRPRPTLRNRPKWKIYSNV